MQSSAPPTVAITQSSSLPQRQQIWWGNASFFVLVHIGAAFGVYYYPVSSTPSQTLWLTFAIWQLATFGITVGYHRLWSHRSFEAGLGVRTVLAVLGTMGFQGSVKWWCLRHRLHHRYTDDPVHDPYSATRGMFYAHMGWIFFKPNYERMAWVDRSDLEADEVVRLQHKYYVPLALISGFILPAIIGRLWNDPIGAFVWAGLVARLMIWHCIFLVNSLAHYDGLQPYTDEDTSRTNWIVALLVAGEGNHNYHHAFPYDYRSDPSLLAWDPSKWLIASLRVLGFAKNTRLAKQDEIERAANLMNYPGTENISHQSMHLEPSVVWTMHDALKRTSSKESSCLILIDGYVVDATDYAPEHPGGASILKLYAINRERSGEASSAFNSRINRHSQAARRKMLDLRVAKLIE